MKTFKITPRPTLITLLFLIFTGAFSSCSNNNDANSVPPAHIMVVNTVKGSAAQDFYLNNNKINSSPVAYGQYSAYAAAIAGTDNAQFFNSGTKTVNTSFSLILEPANYYTVYYTGKNTTSTTYTTVDNLSIPPANYASVQFINFNTDVSSGVDFGVVGSSKIVTNLVSGTASAFYGVAANSSFAVYAAGSLTAKITIPATLQSGMIYTIYITGSSLSDINYNIVVHNPQQ